jgi:hypothetical protein
LGMGLSLLLSVGFGVLFPLVTLPLCRTLIKKV